MEPECLAEFYDYVDPFKKRQDIDFYLDAARSVNGKVLEIGCGTGRILIATARAGFQILGFDKSASMLSMCRKKLEQEPHEVQSRVIDLIQGDMRQFKLDRTFDLVTIPFHPFCYLLTEEDQLECLTNVNHHLRDGGSLVFDFYTPALKHLVDEKYVVNGWQEPEFTIPDGRRVLRRCRFLSRNLDTQVIVIEIVHEIVGPDAREEKVVQTSAFRYFWRFEVESLLDRCGFRTDHVFSGYDKSPYGSKYPGELVFVASKTSAARSR